MATNGPNAKDLRVLSIQSHVVHGYVGNKCALFPLEVWEHVPSTKRWVGDHKATVVRLTGMGPSRTFGASTSEALNIRSILDCWIRSRYDKLGTVL